VVARSAAVGLFLAALAWFGLGVALPASRDLTVGFSAYYSASCLLTHGTISPEIYDPSHFRPVVEELTHGRASDIFNANPPTTSLLFVPLVWLPIEQARMLWTLLSILLLLCGLAVMLRRFAPQAGVVTWLMVFTLGLLFRPVVANVQYGQAYILLFLLLALSAVAFDEGRDAAGGVALASGLMLKTAGWAIVPFLIWQRRWFFLASTLAVSAVTWIAAMPFLSLDMWRAYLRLLPEVTRSPLVCVTAYQTTRSLLCHVFEPTVVWTTVPTLDPPMVARIAFLTLALTTLAGLLLLAARNATAAFVGIATWGVLFAPLGETHHHVVVLVPLTWLLVQNDNRGWFRRGALMAATVLYLLPWPIHHPQLQVGWLAVFAYPRVFAAWLVLVLLLDRLRAPPCPNPTTATRVTEPGSGA